MAGIGRRCKLKNVVTRVLPVCSTGMQGFWSFRDGSSILYLTTINYLVAAFFSMSAALFQKRFA